MPTATYTHHAVTLGGVTRTYTSTPGYGLGSTVDIHVARLGGGHDDQADPGRTLDFWHFVVDTVDAEVDYIMEVHRARSTRARIVADAIDRACLIGDDLPYARVTPDGVVGQGPEVTVEQLAAWAGRLDLEHVLDAIVDAVQTVGVEQ